MSAERPFFSVIMPAYNRAALVGRAIESCLGQSFGDFEIVVVDDGSTDETIAAVEHYADPRIRLFRHECNRGVCPARNTAMAHARGEWFVFFDSDDELLPGALETMHRDVAGAPESVGCLRYMCVDERGTSPDPPHDDRVWDYEAYLRWYDLALFRHHEALPCSRASFYPEVQFPNDRSLELLFHLKLLRRTNVLARREVVRRFHQHLGERASAPSFSKSMLVAVDIAANNELILSGHGEALRRFAPHAYAAFVSGAATAAFLAGRRRAALRFAGEAIRLRPLAPRTYVVLVFGLLGRYPLLALQWLNREVRRRLQFWTALPSSK